MIRKPIVGGMGASAPDPPTYEQAREAARPPPRRAPPASARSPREAVAAAFKRARFTPGGPFAAPFAYPALPDQAAAREQLRRFLVEDAERPAAAAPAPLPPPGRRDGR